MPYFPSNSDFAHITDSFIGPGSSDYDANSVFDAYLNPNTTVDMSIELTTDMESQSVSLDSSLVDLPPTEDFSIGMTQHFVQWLEQQSDERANQIGLELSSLARSDLSGGSFGGLIDANDQVRYQLIIFVHGNSDRAWGGELGGWTATVSHLQNLGYRSAELYATTYGPAHSDQALTAAYQHNVENVLRIRLLIELTLRYICC